jgi:DNA-binding PadR family transcriptional regulator
MMENNMENNNEAIQSILPELKRGVITIAVLKLLDQDQYGYSLQKLLSDLGLEVEQGTLYPLLRRLESQGLLQSAWRVEDEARPRRYYRTSPEGEAGLSELINEWQSLVTTLDKILKDEGIQ